MEKTVDEDGRTYYQGKIKDKNGDVEVKMYDDTECSIEVTETETVNPENGEKERCKEVKVEYKK